MYEDKPPADFEDDVCLACGQPLPPDADRCAACGWSFDPTSQTETE